MLSKILSHGYFLEGFLPVQIAFPSLATMLLGQIDIPDKMLVESFITSLSSVECELLKQSLRCEQFSSVVNGKLVDHLSRLGSRQMPTPSNLRVNYNL